MYLPGWLPTGIEDEKKTHFLMALDGLDDLFSTTIGIYSNKLQIIGFIFSCYSFYASPMNCTYREGTQNR